jgi:DNA-binding transcriptional LysR family regulator
MELRQLKYFVAVADTLHFGQAAERLHVGQPAVSQQIRRLEAALGVRLFDRTPRHVRLTSAGERFLPEARAVLAAADRAQQSVDPRRRRGDRALRVGLCAGLGDYLEHVLDRLAVLRPDVDLDLLSTTPETRLRDVAAGRLDASFVRGGNETSEVRVLAVRDEPLLVALPADHPLARGPVVISDLAGLPLRLTNRSDNPLLVDIVLTACAQAGFEPKPASPLGRLESTLAAIGAGAATWTVVYAAHARVLRTHRVAFVPLSDRSLRVPTGLALPRIGAREELDALVSACVSANDHEC